MLPVDTRIQRTLSISAKSRDGTHTKESDGTAEPTEEEWVLPVMGKPAKRSESMYRHERPEETPVFHEPFGSCVMQHGGRWVPIA